MNCIRAEAKAQIDFSHNDNISFLMIPSALEGFSNTDTSFEMSKSGRTVYCFSGNLKDDMPRTCSCCGSRMHVNNHLNASLRHLCFGGALTVVKFAKLQLRCPECGATVMQDVPFKAKHHRITQELYNYARDLLALGNYTNRQVGQITGLDENTVKTIDKRRLQEEYTIDGKKLIRPEHPARILGIDEFKLHDGHRYATHIIDMDNGHIQPVFDHFHIVKNFNDKVIGAVRKDEQKRLQEEGDVEAAKSLKRTKYILTSSRKTLQRKDTEAKVRAVTAKI